MNSISEVRSCASFPHASRSPYSSPMSHDAQLPTSERVSLERRILRQICSDSLSREDMNRAIDKLAQYAWREPEHDVLFKAIRRLGGGDAGRLREELPAQLTRMGFPDIDWPRYFAAETKDFASLDDLLLLLVSGTGERG